MIGLIGEIKDIYSIIDRIHNTFPKIMIYVFSGESNDNKVKELMSRGCKIIILGDGSIYQERYPDCRFLSFDEELEKVELDLIELIDRGDEHGIGKIISNMEIYDNTITLHHPKLLFIKHIIEEMFPGIVIKDSTSSLINDIKKYESILLEVEDAEVKMIVGNYNED